jgi:hypothetical protein
MSLAVDLYVDAFGSGTRTPRSAAYEKGAMAALTRIFDGTCTHAPYSAGTADFDAYIAGRQEGHQIAAAHMQACAASEDTA